MYREKKLRKVKENGNKKFSSAASSEMKETLGKLRHVEPHTAPLPSWGMLERQSPADSNRRHCPKKWVYCVGFGNLECMIRAVIGVGSRLLFFFSRLCKVPEGGRITQQVFSSMEDKMKMSGAVSFT